MLLSICFLLTLAFAQRLAPGNKIRLICEQEPTLSVERVLSKDGDVLLPLLGRINLAGKYIVEAEDELQRLANRKLGTDHILIAITLVTDDRGPIEFSGAVSRSGSVPFRVGITLDDVVKLAEPSGAAATEAIEITGADGKRVIVDLGVQGGGIKLRPGDHVFFPRAEVSNEVLILGGVARPGSKVYKPDLTIRGLVEIAGGITGHGFVEKIKLERKGQEAKTIDLNSADADMKLQRGDIVTVPVLEKGGYVTVVGFVGRPGIIEFREGMTLTQAIKAAGGLSMFAGPESIVVKRVGDWRHKYNFRKIMAGQEKDVILKAADIIEVPTGTWRKVQDPKAAPPKEKPRSHPVVPPR